MALTRSSHPAGAAVSATATGKDQVSTGQHGSRWVGGGKAWGKCSSAEEGQVSSHPWTHVSAVVDHCHTTFISIWFKSKAVILNLNIFLATFFATLQAPLNVL